MHKYFIVYFTLTVNSIIAGRENVRQRSDDEGNIPQDDILCEEVLRICEKNAETNLILRYKDTHG